jgi:hypothetical protein
MDLAVLGCNQNKQQLGYISIVVLIAVVLLVAMPGMIKT